jgi:hypothetical protein
LQQIVFGHGAEVYKTIGTPGDVSVGRRSGSGTLDERISGIQRGRLIKLGLNVEF